ncbi:MAG: hypothetical protein ABI661_10715 [Gammaproteobacteria bacterium]
MHKVLWGISCPVLLSAALLSLCAPALAGETPAERAAWRVIPGQDVCVMIAKAAPGPDDALVVSLIWRKVWPAGPERTLIFVAATYLEHGGEYLIAAPGVSLDVPTDDTTIVLDAKYAEKLKLVLARQAPWSVTAIPLNGARRTYSMPTLGARDAVKSFDTCVREKKRGELRVAVLRLLH